MGGWKIVRVSIVVFVWSTKWAPWKAGVAPVDQVQCIEARPAAQLDSARLLGLPRRPEAALAGLAAGLGKQC
jgi:hypothetical protein